MPAKTRGERIEKLRARLEQLEQKEKTVERKRRTRRLILLGSLAEEMAKTDTALALKLRSLADERLVRKIDREAFDLPIRSADDTQPGGQGR